MILYSNSIILIFLTCSILVSIITAENDCLSVCNVDWKIPSTFTGKKDSYQSRICGHTINKVITANSTIGKNSSSSLCKDNAFYHVMYYEGETRMLCQGPFFECKSPEECQEDLEDKIEDYSDRCLHPKGKLYNSKLCICPNEELEKIPLTELKWTNGTGRIISNSTEEIEEDELSPEIESLLKGYYTARLCGHEMNTINKNSACKPHEIYECLKANATGLAKEQRFPWQRGFPKEIPETCKECITDPGNKRERKCSP